MARARFVLLLIASFLVITPAAAQEVIDERSGNLVLTAVDTGVIAGAVQLDVRRSLSHTSTSSGLLGSRWRFNWEMRLARSNNEVVIEDGTATIPFRPAKATGEYQSANGERLTIRSDGRAVRSRSDGTVDIFDAAQGRLLERDLLNGNRIQLRYSSGGRLAEVVGPKNAALRFTLDGEGRVTKIEASSGHVVQYAYTAGELARVDNSSGETLRYTYTSGLLTRIERAATGATQLSYDTKQRVTSRRFADGSEERWEYDDSTRRLRHIDVTGAATTQQWSADGRVQEIVDPLGNRSLLQYDEQGHVTQATGPTGRSVRLVYDSLGRLTRAQEAKGQATVTEYLGQTSLVTAVTDPDGVRHTFDYDAQRNVTAIKVGGVTQVSFTYLPDGLLESVKDRSGAGRRMTYTADGHVASITDGLGKRTQFEYDQRGNLIRETNPAGGATIRKYDASDRLVAEADPTGATSRFEYDASSRLNRVTDPLGATTSYEYDAAGRRVAMIDPAGRRQRNELDMRQRLRTVTFADGRREQDRFDAIGQLVENIDPLGRLRRFSYDSLGRLISERLPSGPELRYQYDAQGRIVGIENSLGGKSAYNWDAANYLSSVTNARGGITRFRYDAAGRVIAAADPLNREVRYDYDAADRLTKITTPAGEVASYRYDVEGHLIEIRHPSGLVTQFTRDALGNIISTKGPGRFETRSTYSAAGDRIATTSAAGQTINFRYDAAGRLVNKEFAGKRAIRQRYDALDQLLEADDGQFPVRYEYDPHGRLTAVIYSKINKGLHYAYDSAGLLTKLTTAGGTEIGYRYDSLKRLASIVAGGANIDFAYDKSGNLASIRYPNGVIATWQYDLSGAIQRLAYAKGSTTIASWDVARNAAGELASLKSIPAPSREYRYDRDGRLVDEKIGAQTITYAYRAGGDRVRRTSGAETVAYQYDGDGRLTTAGAERFVQDPGARMSRREGSGGATTYAYDESDQLIRATMPGGENVEFGYAASGERVWRRDKQGLVYFIHDGLNLTEELNANGGSSAVYVHGPGVDWPLALIRDGRTYFYHADALGNIALLTDGQGQIVAAYDTDAFGAVRNAKSSVVNPFIFAGREYEPALGLYFFRARWYDPGLGRFLTPDPNPGSLADPATLNPYVFALNAPTNFRDPLGLFPTKIDYDWIYKTYGVAAPEVRQLLRETVTRLIDSGQPAREAVKNAHYLVERAIEQGPGLRLGNANPNMTIIEASRLPSTTPGQRVADARAWLGRPIRDAPGMGYAGALDPQRPDVYIRNERPTAIRPGNPATAAETPGNVVSASEAASSGASSGSSALPRGSNTLTVPRQPVGTNTGAVEGAPARGTNTLKIDPTAANPSLLKGVGGSFRSGALFGAGLNAGLCALFGGSKEQCADAAGRGAWQGGLWSAGTKLAENGAIKLTGQLAAGPLVKAISIGTGLGLAIQPITKWFLGPIKTPPLDPNRPLSPQAQANLILQELTTLRRELDFLRNLQAKITANFGRLKTAGGIAEDLRSLTSRPLPEPLPGETPGAGLPPPSSSEISYCARAANALAALRKAATDAKVPSGEMVRLLTTNQYPPQSTPGIITAKEAAQKLKITGPQVPPPATELRGLREVLRKVLQDTDTASTGQQKIEEQIRTYNAAKDDLKALAVQVEADAKQFQARKAGVRGSAVRMQSQAPADRQAEFGEVVNRIDELTIPAEAVSAQKFLADVDKTITDAGSELTRFLQNLKKEAKDCAQWKGWSDLQRQAEEARDSYAGAVQSAVSAYDARVTKITAWVKHAERIITVDGPKKIQEARAARDAKMERDTERIIQDTRELKAAGERESLRLKEFEPLVADLKRVTQATREIRFDR